MLFKLAQLQNIENMRKMKRKEDSDEVLEALNLPSKGSESDTNSDYAFGSDTDDLACPNGESSKLVVNNCFNHFLRD